MGARRVTAVIGLLFALMIGAASPASAMTTPTPQGSPTSIPPTDSPMNTATQTRIPASSTPIDPPATETMTPRATNTLGASSGIAATASAIAAQSTVGPTRTPSASGSGEATALPPGESTAASFPTSDSSATARATRQAPTPDASHTPTVVRVLDNEDGGGGQMLLFALLIAAALTIIGVSQATRRTK